MNSIQKKILIYFLILIGVSQAFILISSVQYPPREIIFVSVRPPLTRPEFGESLLINISLVSKNKEEFGGVNNYSAEEIAGTLGFLERERLLPDRKQVLSLLPSLKKIFDYKKRINYLFREAERKKAGLEFKCIEMGKVLKWSQLDYVISNTDFFTFNIYEFPYWLKLLGILEKKIK